jgi:hypothetical protein
MNEFVRSQWAKAGRALAAAEAVIDTDPDSAAWPRRHVRVLSGRSKRHRVSSPRLSPCYPQSTRAVCCSSVFGAAPREPLLRPAKVAPRVGLEPTTYRLTAGRSTIELSGIGGPVRIAFQEP